MSTSTLVGTLPNFLLIGAMRSGSTSLHKALSDHPEIFMSQPKELHFFVETRNWDRGLQWYVHQFAKAAEFPARGEASVTYTQFPQVAGVPARAASVLPTARLIYLVRDPIARMRSQYEHDLRRALAGTAPSGWARIAAHGSAGEALVGQQKYVDASSYAKQLDQWLEYYPADNICVLTSEWLWQDPRAAMREVFAFLGVDTGFEPADQLEHLNEATRPRRRSPLADHPVMNSLARKLPASVKDRLRPREAPVPDLAHLLKISADLDSVLRERIRDDVSRLRPYIRGPFDGWGIA
jgi:LPS sulfotransferase NodH